MVKEYSQEKEYSEKLLVRISHTHEMGTSGNAPNPGRPHLGVTLPWEEFLKGDAGGPLPRGSFNTPIRGSCGWPYLGRGLVFQ